MEDRLRAAQRKAADKWLGRAGVVWLDVGEKVTGGQPTGIKAVKIGVIVKKPLSALRADEIIPPDVDGVPTDVIEVGEIIALDTGQHRPAFGGNSCGHVEVTAGTISVPGKRLGERMVLSNSHVIAMQNDAQPGDGIVQPGPFDFGADPEDRIAEFLLAAWIQFEGQSLPSPMPAGYVSQGYPNEVDAAVGRVLSPDLVKPEVGTWGAVQGTKAAAVGDLVRKIGRTTNETHGQVAGVASDVLVNYGGPTGRFKNQVTITPGSFSAGGDSGSLIVTESDPLKATALLFAGSSAITIANPIDRVLALLGFEFVTEEAPIVFPDVPGHWAETEIMEWVAEGIFSGYPDGLFHPNDPVTRAQFCVLLSRLRAAGIIN